MIGSGNATTLLRRCNAQCIKTPDFILTDGDIISYYNKCKKKIISDIGERPTSNIQLMNYSKKNHIDLYQVVPADYIDLTIKSKYLISNTDESDKNGTHWIVLYGYPSQNLAIFYDPLGFDYRIYPNIVKIAKKYNNRIICTNSSPEQQILTTICGQLCLSFIQTCMKYDIINVMKVI